jgi:2-dehydropantoate 2-reductase
MKVGIFGAGAIGCYVGGRLAASGADVVMVGRSSLVRQYETGGMTITDCDGFSCRLSGSQIHLTVSPDDLRSCDVIIVTVKSTDTAAAAVTLATSLQGVNPLIISLQNGVSNAAELARQLPPGQVCGAMVPFNVLRSDGTKFHRGTSGAIIVSDRGGELARALGALLTGAGVPARTHADIEGVLWGKLVLNLNNALNALSGLPIRRQLECRGYRVLFSRCIDEALRVLKRAGIKPVSVVGAPPVIVSSVLRLPDFLFFRIASTMLKIDPRARSSTWQDLENGRKTEIDYLNGEILRLAERWQMDVPLNKRIVDLIRKVETERILPEMTPADIAGGI